MGVVYVIICGIMALLYLLIGKINSIKIQRKMNID